MMSDSDDGKSAADYARDAVRDVDPDGGGYRIREAVQIMVHRVVRDGLTTPDGRPNSAVLQLLQRGSAEYIKQFRPEFASKPLDMPTPESVSAAPRVDWGALSRATVAGQADMAELSDEFAWMLSYTALDESQQATRKQYLALTYHEILQVIALKRKKASQTLERAMVLEDVIRRNPDWKRQPHRTLADVLSDAP